MKRLILFVLILLTVGAQAKLGETLEEIEARYGKPISIPPANEKVPLEHRLYKANAYQIMVVYVDKKSAMEQMVIPQDSTNQISVAQAKAFAGAVTGVKEWTFLKDNYHWRGGEYTLGLTTNQRIATVLGKTYLTAQAAAKKQMSKDAKAIEDAFGGSPK